MIVTKILDGTGYRPRGIVHVGACYAEEMDDYLAFSPQLIVWVEADPGRWSGCVRKINAYAGRFATRQLAIQCLVADQDGEPFEFKEYSNAGASSSIYASTEILRRTWPGVRETGDVSKFNSRRLDTALCEAGVTSAMVDVLVLDIQGAELLALKGAGEFLERAQFVEVELSIEPIYEGAPLAAEVDGHLVGAGFERLGDIPWHGDAVYRRRA